MSSSRASSIEPSTVDSRRPQVSVAAGNSAGPPPPSRSSIVESRRQEAQPNSEKGQPSIVDPRRQKGKGAELLSAPRTPKGEPLKDSQFAAPTPKAVAVKPESDKSRSPRREESDWTDYGGWQACAGWNQSGWNS